MLWTHAFPCRQGGFVPGFASGQTKVRGETQPPVTGKALWEIAKRWGPEKTKWAVELCFEDLFTWNTWLYTQRRLLPLGLVTCAHTRNLQPLMMDGWVSNLTDCA